MSDLEHQRTQPSETNPDIAHTTDALKANYARPSVYPPEANKDKTRRVGHLPLMAGGAAVAIAAVAGGYFATRGGDVTSPEQSSTTQSGPANPGELEPNSKEWTPESLVPELSELELSAEEYSDGEQLTRAYISLTNDWMMAGGSKESLDNQDYSITLDEWVHSISTPIDTAYTDALFVDNWQHDESLKLEVEDMQNDHRIYVMASLKTQSDSEPYVYYRSVESTGEELNTPNQIISTYRYTSHDNFDKNSAYRAITESLEGTTGGGQITWVKEEGAWKIADIEYYAG